MNASDGLLVLVRSGAVLLAALSIVVSARRNPALRVAAARWGLAGALLLALATPFLRERPRPLVPVTMPARATFAVAAPSPPAPQERPVAGASRPVETTLASEPLDLVAFVPAAWALGSGLLFLQLLAALVLLARMRRGCVPVADGEFSMRMERLAQEAGVATPRAFEGRAVAGPCVAGLWRAAIYLPTGWAAATDAEVVDAVLRHELAHVANGDLRWGLLARVARILLWPQPLAWALRGPQAAAEEEACDRQVLALGTSQARYAAGLLALREARRTARVPSLAIGAVSRRSGFGRRVEAILAFRGGSGARLSRRASLAVRAGTLALALGAAYAFARPGEAAAQGPDPYASWIKTPYAARVALIDAKGRPVVGAKAWRVVSNGVGAPKVEALTVEGSTLALPGGTLSENAEGTLAVRAPGYALALARLWPAPARLTVTLVAPISVTGRLLLPDGRPAAGLPVVATLLVGLGSPPGETVFLRTEGLPDPAMRTMTDADGRFRFGGLPPATSVAYEVDDDRYARLGFNDRVSTPKIGEAAAKPVTLKIAGRVAGRATRDGKPVAGLRVEAQSVNDEMMANRGAYGDAVTDADGRYAIERLGPSVYNVAVDLSGGLQEETTTRAHERVRVAEGEKLAGMDFDLVPGTLIEGTATLSDGKPVVGAYVGVYGPAHPDSGAWVQTSRTDAQGRYRLRVPAGAQRVYLADDRYEGKESRATTQEGAPTTVDFRVTPKAPEQATPTQEAAEVAVQPQEKPETSVGPVASFGSGKPFYGPVRLPNGTTVRLTTVQDGGKGDPIWRPDGGPVGAAERAAALDMEGFGENGADDPVRRLFLRVEIEGAERKDVYAIVRVPQPSNWNVWQTYGDPKGNSRDLASFRAHRTLRVTDMRFGVAAGPSRTIASGAPGSSPLFARVRSGGGAPPQTLVGDATVAVTVRFPASAEGQDVRLAAFTKDGRELELASWQNDTERAPKTGERVRTYGFSGGSAKEIARVELRARPYRWATFRGIHLYPNGR